MSEDEYTLESETGQKIRVTLIHLWDRDALKHETAAPTFHNAALTIFNTIPQCSRVAMFFGTRRMLMLAHVAHRWFDVSAQPVKVSKGW